MMSMTERQLSSTLEQICEIPVITDEQKSEITIVAQ